MAYSLDDKLVIAISSRALLALEEADAVFVSRGSRRTGSISVSARRIH
jgi:hypothetical protein